MEPVVRVRRSVTVESVAKMLEGMAQVIRREEMEELSGFGCNRGPNLRTLLDSATIFPNEQRVYCVYRTFDSENREIALKTLGLFPVDPTAVEKEDTDYLLLVRVIMPGESSVVVGNGKTRLRHNDIFVGMYNPHERFGTFHRFS